MPYQWNIVKLQTKVFRLRQQQCMQSNLDIFMGNMRVVHLNYINYVNSSVCSSSMGNLHTLYSSVNMEVVVHTVYAVH